jgi:hypothetical protein
MNAQFIVEYGIALPPSTGVTKVQGANRRAIEATLRSMKKGGSFAISSPHLTGEVHCVAANLGLHIKIGPYEKAWRCWLLSDDGGGGKDEEVTLTTEEGGTLPPKSLPPELFQSTPISLSTPTPTPTTNVGRSEAALTTYLERRGLQPEYAQSKIRYRHPQRLSRILTLYQIKNGEVLLSFAHALPEFTEMWNLSTEGELPLNLEEDEVYEALDDFFEIVFENPPPGSLPFEVRLKEVDEIIRRVARRRECDGNYEINYTDLIAIGQQKAYEVYIRFGDKPTYEFQCLVKRSIERKFNSLLSKHYRAQCRVGATVTALTDEMTEVLTLEAPEEIVTKEEWNEYLESLTPTERLLMKCVIHPTDSLRAEKALDQLRYERIKAQQPKSRLTPPKYRLRKLALSTSKSENELKIAIAHLIETRPSTSTVWDELVESLNG